MWVKSWMRRHAKKTLRDITSVASLSSKPSRPSRVLQGHVGRDSMGTHRSSAHVLCSIVWTPHSQTDVSRHLPPSFRAGVWAPTPVWLLWTIWKPLLKSLHVGKVLGRHSSFSSTTLPLRKKWCSDINLHLDVFIEGTLKKWKAFL